eukprot:CAMPEP_0117601976 /NCGR_PEP_ID=MMETSP0784-20121206/77326_1 /TAXON_ID=39447 /ORGANISM="" /LENGTH=521 /DNA_ID=CAMNT_0005404747 /DNA_START=109 /DNA_END=1672 /DNA_ORIENTATION=+
MSKAAGVEEWTAEEKQLRMDLSVAHKLTSIYGFDELVWNHISCKLSDGCILLTSGKSLFSEVEPEDLKKSSGNVTADIIHKAVYAARPDVKAIVHLHTSAATAVSCLESGFSCLAQDSAPFYDRVGYHDWEGISDDTAECDRLGAAVKGNVRTLLMRNHGFCAFGETVAEAWVFAYFFENSCRNLLSVLSTRQAIRRPPAEVFEKARRQAELPGFRPGSEWDALVRLVKGNGVGVRKPRRSGCLPKDAIDSLASARACGEEHGEEAALRAELAVAHRLTHEFGMDQLVWNHISARLSGDAGVLVTPGRLMYHEINAEDLLKSSHNSTSDVIHTAVYTARPDVHAIVHLHTPSAVAVSCLEGGFMCVAQHAAPFFGRVAYHDWEGISDDKAESERIAAAVKSGTNVLVMRNHGFCTFGKSVAEAWVLAYYFEKSCETQISVLQTGQAIRKPKAEVMAHAAKQSYLPGFAPGDSEWDALTRLVKRRRLHDVQTAEALRSASTALAVLQIQTSLPVRHSWTCCP